MSLINEALIFLIQNCSLEIKEENRNNVFEKYQKAKTEKDLWQYHYFVYLMLILCFCHTKCIGS